MTRGTLTLLLGLACAACGTDTRGEARRAPSDSARRVANAPPRADTAASSDTAPPDPPPPHVDPPGTAYLVWSADTAHAETAWLRDDGSVRAVRPQVVVAVGGGLWAWIRRMRPAAGADCGCVRRRQARDRTFLPEDARPGLCYERTPRPTVVTVDLLGGRELRLLGVPDSVPDGEAPPMQGMEPIGSVGPYLFAETWLYSYFCGANHGMDSHAFPVFDLAHGGREVHLVRGDTFRVLARQARQARERLSGRAFTPLGEFSLTSVEPLWRAGGRLEIGYRFAAAACWACGDEHAAGYSASERVAGPVPPLLRPWASAPLPVRRYWGTHPPLEHAGWSAVPPADTARALRRFRAR
jgi:hypothetical protein